MINNILFGNIINFSVTIFAAFATFSTGLLYFDSWQVSKKKQTTVVRSVGFFLLSLTFLSSFFFSSDIVQVVSEAIRNLALSIILLSLFLEPLLKKPVNAFIPSSIGILNFIFIPTSAILSFAICGAYIVKAKKGLEKQLLPAGISFFFFGLSESLKAIFLAIPIDNVAIVKLFSDFGPIWYIKLALVFIGSFILAGWAWGYIRFRLQIQIFVSTLAITLLVFVSATSLFTLLLTKNIENNALSSLETDGKVFQYALERLEFEALSNARSSANDTDLRNALVENDKEKLFEISNDFLVSQNANVLDITDDSGKVIARAENKEKIGDNISTNQLVESALKGQELTSVLVEDGVITPELRVAASYPVVDRNTNNIEGVTYAAFVIDDAFLDGIKSVTGLDVSIYAGDTQVATTLLSPDGISRYTGSRETNESVTNSVLKDGEIYLGVDSVLNQSYYATYLPIKQYGGNVIGMLFAGKPQTTLLETMQKSIDSTFLGSSIFIVLSIAPIFFLSKYIKENLEA